MKAAAVSLVLLAGLTAVHGRSLLQGAASANVTNQFGTCSEVAGANITQFDLAVVRFVDSPKSCCQFCQAFSLLVSQPCRGYTYVNATRECHLKPTSNLTTINGDTVTSGAMAISSNCSSAPAAEVASVSVTPAAGATLSGTGTTSGSCQIQKRRYLWTDSYYNPNCHASMLDNFLNIGSAQDCCNQCMANEACNMFDWCDPAIAKDEKCNPGGLEGRSLPGECILWQSSKAKTSFQFCTKADGGSTTWHAGIIEGRDPPPEP